MNPPRVRGPWSVRGRALLGAAAGAGVGALADPDGPAVGAGCGGCFGLLLGGVAGVVVWVAFPYRRPDRPI